MSFKTVWIVEYKWHKRGRHWTPSIDHFPFRYKEAAELSAKESQDKNPGWQYRAVEFMRSTLV